IGRGTAQHPAPAGVDELEPLTELVVEIAGAAELPTRQKRPLEIVVGPLNDALVFWLSRFQDHHLGAQHAAERLAVSGQLRLTGPIPSDRSLAVPDQGTGH